MPAEALAVQQGRTFNISSSERARALAKLSVEARQNRAAKQKEQQPRRQHRAAPNIATLRRTWRNLLAYAQASTDIREKAVAVQAARDLFDMESILIGRVVQTGKVRSTNPLPKLEDLEPLDLPSTVPLPCRPEQTPVQSPPQPKVDPTQDDCPF